MYNIKYVHIYLLRIFIHTRTELNVVQSKYNFFFRARTFCLLEEYANGQQVLTENLPR